MLKASSILGNSQRLAEQYRFNGHWKLLGEWLQQLVELRALLGSLGQAAPRVTSRGLREQLDALIQDWRPRIEAGSDDEAIRQTAPDDFAAELAQPRWGLFSLKASLWLLQRGWTAERNNRGNRQGAAELGNWLPRQLGEEAEALQLLRYQQQPEDLAEQRPRMERLLVWLHLARDTLDLPEADRLYGELAKLHELAAQPIGDDLLDARIEQARRVWTLKPWKLLMK